MATPRAAKTKLPSQVPAAMAIHCQASRRTPLTTAATSMTSRIDGRLTVAAAAILAAT